MRKNSAAPPPTAAQADATVELATPTAPREVEEPLDCGGSTRHAYEQLRRKIVTGELAPGARFSQVQLASQLGVSRTPLREAVRRLQTEGLLQSERNRRVRVAPLSTEDFEDLYVMRIVLESLAVRLTVPHLGRAELASIRLAYIEATTSAERGDFAGYREPHRQFHFGLYRHTGARLIGRIEDLWDHAERYRRLSFEHAAEGMDIVRLNQRDHATILEAAEDRDGALTARRMAEHLARMALMTLVQTDPRHDPAQLRTALDHVCAELPAASALPASYVPGAAAAS